MGAGPAGFAVSAALAVRGLDHIVLEQARVGETGRTQRWDSFRLNTPGWMNQMLGGQLPSVLDDHFLEGALAPPSVRRS